MDLPRHPEHPLDTHLDAPWHRYADGPDLSELSLDSVAHLDGVRVGIDPVTVAAVHGAIGAEAFEGVDVAGRAVLVHTGWSRHWNTEAYYEGHSFLTEPAAIHLRDAGARLVGIDSHTIDDVRGGERPVHTMLLGAGVLIVEHLTALDELPNLGFRFYAVPVKVRGMGTFPVRTFAEID